MELPGSDMPSASASAFMVEAVPMVLQCLSDVSANTQSTDRSSEAVPVRLHCPGDGADAHTRSINSE